MEEVEYSAFEHGLRLSKPGEKEDQPSQHLEYIESCDEFKKADPGSEFDAAQQLFEAAPAKLFRFFPSTVFEVCCYFLAILTSEIH